MKSLDDIKSTIAKHKKEIVLRFSINKIAIFGSWAKGIANKKSDIDILVDFDQTPDIFLLIDLEEYLQKILKRKIDLVRLSAIREEIKKKVMKEAIFL